MDWMRANRLKLNPEETAILLLGGHPDWLGGLLPDLDGLTHTLKDWVCNLGVLLDLALSMKNQILAMTSKADGTPLPLS